MTSANDDLRKRILEDELLDGHEADQLREKLTRQFDRKRKKMIVIVAFYLLVFLVIMGAGLKMLFLTSDVRLMILAGVIVLIGYEGTVLVKIWGAVVDSLLQIKREIKNLGLLVLTKSSGEGAVGAAEEKRWGDSVGVKTTQWISMVIVAVFGIWGFSQYVGPAFEEAWRSDNPFMKNKVYEEHIVIQPDGSCRVTTKQSHVYAGMNPKETLEIDSDNALKDAAWWDGQGNVLQHEERREKGGYHYTVRLARPVFRGEVIDVRSSGTSSGLARQENGKWTLTNRRTWGKEQIDPLTMNDYPWPQQIKITKTIALPPGAQSGSRTPENMAWTDWDNRQILCYQETKKPGELEEVRITYTLPGGAASKPAK